MISKILRKDFYDGLFWFLVNGVISNRTYILMSALLVIYIRMSNVTELKIFINIVVTSTLLIYQIKDFISHWEYPNQQNAKLCRDWNSVSETKSRVLKSNSALLNWLLALFCLVNILNFIIFWVNSLSINWFYACVDTLCIFYGKFGNCVSCFWVVQNGPLWKKELQYFLELIDNKTICSKIYQNYNNSVSKYFTLFVIIA